METPKEPTYTWLAVTNGSGKYIVKTSMSRDDVIREHNSGGSIGAAEVYDYGCPIREVAGPQGQTGIAKMHFCSRMDSTLYPCTARIHLAGSVLYFLNDLKEGDALQYKSFIQDAANSSLEAAKHRAERESGIVLTGDMPGGGRLGRSHA